MVDRSAAASAGGCRVLPGSTSTATPVPDAVAVGVWAPSASAGARLLLLTRCATLLTRTKPRCGTALAPRTDMRLCGPGPALLSALAAALLPPASHGVASQHSTGEEGEEEGAWEISRWRQLQGGACASPASSCSLPEGLAQSFSSSWPSGSSCTMERLTSRLSRAAGTGLTPVDWNSFLSSAATCCGLPSGRSGTTSGLLFCVGSVPPVPCPGDGEVGDWARGPASAAFRSSCWWRFFERPPPPKHSICWPCVRASLAKSELGVRLPRSGSVGSAGRQSSTSGVLECRTTGDHGEGPSRRSVGGDT